MIELSIDNYLSISAEEVTRQRILLRQLVELKPHRVDTPSSQRQLRLVTKANRIHILGFVVS